MLIRHKEKLFSEKTMYELLCRIPKGSVCTYGEIARALGNSAQENNHAKEKCLSFSVRKFLIAEHG